METTFEEKPITGRGGYRPNAGRPKGAKNLLSTPKKAILEYTSPQELKNMVERAKKAAKRNDKMLQWYLEMVFGKPKTIEKDGPTKQTNNIAFFLDKLENENARQEIIGEVLEDVPPLFNQGQESESDTVQTESGSSSF